MQRNDKINQEREIMNLIEIMFWNEILSPL